MRKVVTKLKASPSKIQAYLRHAVYTREFYFAIIYVLLLFSIFFINTFHEQYPDEFDNILGGKLILQGRLPYVGFFSHHGPVPYFISAVIFLFSGVSFVKFRILYSISLLIFMLLSYIYIRKRFGVIITKYYGYFLMILGISATYFWAHMLIADSFAALLLVPVIAIIALVTLSKSDFRTNDLLIVSFLSSMALLTSLTYLYVVGIIYAYTFYIVVKNNFKPFSVNIIKALGIFAIPYLIFLLYLLVTGSLSDYITQSIIFNQKYYIYNYPGQGGVVNPIRFGITIIFRFYNNILALLHQIPSFNFAFPLNITLALADLSFIVYLIIKRKFSFAAAVFLILGFANARSNPLESSEKDYQDAVYIATSLQILCLSLYFIHKDMKENHDYPNKIILTLFFLLLGTYSFFASMFLTQKFLTKAYGKYMGTEPLIYDRPEVSKYLNQVIDSKETIWYGPLQFQEMYYSNGALPSRYHMLIPGIGRSPEMKEDMLSEYQKNPPNIIWFNTRQGVLGQTPGQYASFFVDFLNQNYVQLENVSINGQKFSSQISPSLDVDFGSMLYIKKDYVEKLMPKLIKAGIVKGE